MGVLADVSNPFSSAVGESVWAELGGHAYTAGAGLILGINQNAGRWPRGLTAEEKTKLRPEFGNLVDKVELWERALLLTALDVPGVGRIPTNPEAQTFGYRVYFQTRFSLDDPESLTLMAHELVHVRQYVNANEDLTLFGNRYFRDFYRSGFRYREMTMEAEAFRFEHCFARRLTGHIDVQTIWRPRQRWTKGWASFMPFELNGQPHYLAYKSMDGTTAIARIREDGQGVDELWRGKWTTGWTEFVPFMLRGTPHYLVYKRATGDTAIGRIWYDGRGTDTIWRADPPRSRGWSALMPFNVGRQHYLAYDEKTGEVAVDRIRDDAMGVETVWRPRQKWTAGWTSLMSYDFGGLDRYLLYKKDTGDVVFAALEGDGRRGFRDYRDLWRGSWSTGWTTFMPFRAGGAYYYLSYKIGTGDVAIDRISDFGARYQTEWCHQWTTGWSTFMPFVLRGQPHYLGYKMITGDVAIDRIAVS